MSALQAEIRKVKALTTKPFGVNLTLLPALSPPDYPAYVRQLRRYRGTFSRVFLSSMPPHTRRDTCSIALIAHAGWVLMVLAIRWPIRVFRPMSWWMRWRPASTVTIVTVCVCGGGSWTRYATHLWSTDPIASPVLAPSPQRSRRRPCLRHCCRPCRPRHCLSPSTLHSLASHKLRPLSVSRLAAWCVC